MYLGSALSGVDSCEKGIEIILVMSVKKSLAYLP